MSFLFGNATAATTTAATGAAADSSFSIVIMVAIFLIFYFMLIRPQNKRAKEQRELMNKVKKGDEIITSGGLLATIVSTNEQYIKVNAGEGVELFIQRAAISSILPKGTIKTL